MDKARAAALLAEWNRRKGTAAASRWIPHAPTPRQAAFLALEPGPIRDDDTAENLEALYGGAAGGGKSDALLMAALAHVEVPGYSALLLRRTFADLALRGALMDRAAEWLRPTGAVWNEQRKQWRFPSGATLGFGYLETANDRYRYQGANFHFIGVDELTQFEDVSYLYLMTRLRRGAHEPVRARMRAASNPGGIGHDWVKARFVDPGHPDRPFVPARLEDNPHLDQRSYRAMLSQIDETTRQQLLLGIWVRDSGGLIYPYGPANLLEVLPEMDDLRFVLGVDLGASEQKPSTSFVVEAYHPQLPGVFVPWAELTGGLDVTGTAERIRELAETFGRFDRIVVDEGALGKGYGTEFRKRHGLATEPAEKTNKLGFRKLLRGALQRGEVQIVAPQCEALLEEMGRVTWNPEGTDVEKGVAVHVTDALLYGWRACKSYLHEPPETRLIPGTVEALEAEAAELRRRAVRRATEKARRPWWHR